MAQTPETAKATGRRRGRTRLNWAAAVTAIAALLSGGAAMITAATGIWHPPVPIPVVQARISWVGPTPAQVAAQSPTVQAASSPTPSPSPSRPSSYQADWSTGMDGWVGGAEWKTVASSLISDGHSADGRASSGLNAVRPPFRPDRPDYVVTARIKIVSDPQQYGCGAALQLRVAPEGQGQELHGYALGYLQGSGAVITRFYPSGNTVTIVHTTFSPGGDWHEYSASVKDNQLTLMIDGSTVLQAEDNNYVDAGQVGVMGDACQLQVGSFTLTPA